jgi:transposase
MDASHLASLLLPLPQGLRISDVTVADTLLILQVFSTHPLACCPDCGFPSSRVHSRYVRTVGDLPCAGRQIVLKLTVRKFLCSVPDCPRTMFTERLPDLVQSYARVTNRLREALVALGLATSAEVSERVAPSLGMLVSAPTLLRCLRTVSCPPPTKVRILGVDDWAWKKGQIYGTLLVNLELGKPIELLPDRKEATLEAWLRLHPEIEVISRDRGGEYAAAARRGAPQAKQIADKFHLLLNLREKLKELMARKQKLLPHVETPPLDAIPDKAPGALSAPSPSPVLSAEKVPQSFRNMSARPRAVSSDSAVSSPEETPSQISRSNRSAR